MSRISLHCDDEPDWVLIAMNLPEYVYIAVNWEDRDGCAVLLRDPEKIRALRDLCDEALKELEA